MHSTKQISYNVVISLATKGISFSIQFVLFRVLLECIPQTEYGVWLTISSVFLWFSFFDLGVGNGLKNRLAANFSLGEYSTAQSLVSTTYLIYSLLFLIVFLVFFIGSFFVNWQNVLDIKFLKNRDLWLFFLSIFFLFCLRFVLSIVLSIGTARQFSSIIDIQGLFINSIILILCASAITFNICNFFSIAIIHSLVPIIVLLVMSLILFSGKYADVKPTLASVDRSLMRGLFSSGNQFFILQISGLFLNNSSNFLINWLVSSEDVVVYNAAFRYLSIISIAFYTISYPFWSAFTSAYAKKDLVWVRKSLKQLLLCWIGLILLGVLFHVFGPTVYNIWLGDKIQVPASLSLLLLIQVLVSSWNLIFIFFCNALDIMRIQIAFSLITLFATIPVAYILVKFGGFGMNGIVVGNILFQLMSAIGLPFVVRDVLVSKNLWDIEVIS